MRQELDERFGVGRRMVNPKPWPEPVGTAELLAECATKIRKYVMLDDRLLTTAALWVAHTWLYNHDVPTHSPLLAATSAEPDSGKTTFIAVAGQMTPRFSLNIEFTGPALFRMIDHDKPTLGIDEADDLFARKGDLKHIINAGWIRGATISRTETINGEKVVVPFSIFTPKMIALLGKNLPLATRTRRIELRMLPKRKDEHVEDFNHLDNTDFGALRSMFFRWAADNHAALKVAMPVMPEDLHNRVAANWKLLLAIAELAGTDWPQRAREAAVRLTRTGRQPSDGVRLLAKFKEIFASRQSITSKEVIRQLASDELSLWADYGKGGKGGGPITERQIALLLGEDQYGIHPSNNVKDPVTGLRVRGYRAEDFQDAFARYLPAGAYIRTSASSGDLELSGDLSGERPSRKRKGKRTAKRTATKRTATKRTAKRRKSKG